MKRLRWGILGCGTIAKKFALGLKSASTAELVAVSSRSLDKAKAFGSEFNVATAHGSYQALVADSNVDAVYVATPHPQHKDAALLCLNAKKAVLCEKPFTVNRREAESVFECAQKNKTFIMEAMWSRFLPAMLKIRELLSSGMLGDIRLMEVDFGFRAGTVNPESRLFSPALAGGALLDVGVYTVSFAQSILGCKPTQIVSTAHLGSTGVDEQNAIVLRYPQGELAVLSSAIRVNTAHAATIYGSLGRLEIPKFWCASTFTVVLQGKEPEIFNLPFEVNGYNYEADEVARCVSTGRLESATLPWADTLAVLEIMDTARSQWNLRYPME